MDVDGTDMLVAPTPPTPEQQIAALEEQVTSLRLRALEAFEERERLHASLRELVASSAAERARLCNVLEDWKERANRAEPYMWAVLYVKTAVILLAMVGAAAGLFVYRTAMPAALLTAAVLCLEGWYQWRARKKRPC